MTRECFAAIGQQYHNLIRAVDDVMIGQQVTVAVDDDAGAEAALNVFLLLTAAVIEKASRQRILEQRRGLIANGFARINIDDGRCGATHGVGVGVACDVGVREESAECSRL